MLKFREATLHDADLLLNWRNNELTRKNSFNKESIARQDHINWLRKTLKEGKSKIWIYVEHDPMDYISYPIGMMRVDYYSDSNFEDYHELSWNINPAFRGKGYGTRMLKQYIEENPGHYIAKILNHNIASFKMVSNVGFKTIASTKDYGVFAITKRSWSDLIDEIEKTRTKNNINWMDILRLAFQANPNKAKEILRRINKKDNHISKLLQELSE